MYKKFDPKLYNENDNPKIRDVVKSALKQIFNINFIDNKKQEIDLISEDGKTTVEMERRVTWENKFPFSTVHIMERHLCNCEKYKDKDSYYLIINKNLDNIGIIPIKNIYNYPLKEMKNRYVLREKGVNIPLTVFKWYKWENNIWNEILIT